MVKNKQLEVECFEKLCGFYYDLLSNGEQIYPPLKTFSELFTTIKNNDLRVNPHSLKRYAKMLVVCDVVMRVLKIFGLRYS